MQPRILLTTLCLTASLAVALPAAAQVRVVTTLPAYASIANAIGAARVTVQSIARGDEDAHFVKPKPSFALMLREAELFITTGLDLELWAPILVDKAGNREIRSGRPGFVSASQGVSMLDVPASASRAAGDVHIYGNPHIYTSPINAEIVAANIAAGLKRVDPEGAADYDRNLAAFRQRLREALYGADLVALLGGETLDRLAASGRLVAFLEDRQAPDGSPLTSKLQGWLGRARALRGEKLVAYHKNWIYFTDLLGLEIAGYVEPKPGIPPSPRHVHELTEQIKQEGISVLIAASYFAPAKPRLIAQRTGCRAVTLPLGPAEIDADAYFRLIDGWVTELTRAYSGKESG